MFLITMSLECLLVDNHDIKKHDRNSGCKEQTISMLFYTTCCQGCQVVMKSVESYSTKVIAIHDEGDSLIHRCWNFMVQVFNTHALHTTERLEKDFMSSRRKNYPSHRVIDMESEFSNLALDIIGLSVFNVSFSVWGPKILMLFK